MGDTRIGGAPVPQPQPDSVDNSQSEIGSASSISESAGQTPVELNADLTQDPAATKTGGAELKSELNMAGDLIKNSLERQLADGYEPKGPILDKPGNERIGIPITRWEDLAHDIDTGMTSINVYNDRSDGIATHYPNGVVYTDNREGASYTPPPGGSLGKDQSGHTIVRDAQGKVVGEVGDDNRFHVHTKFGDYTQQDFGKVAFSPKPGEKQLDVNQLHKSGAVTPNHFEDYGIASDGKTMRFPNGVEYDVKNGTPMIKPDSITKEVTGKDGSREYYNGDTLVARTDKKGLHVPTPDGMITVAKGQVSFAKNPTHPA